MNTKTVTLTNEEIRAMLEALGVAHANWQDDYIFGHLSEREQKFFELWAPISDKLVK